jgi:malonyl-CoA O-methyltransferase
MHTKQGIRRNFARRAATYDAHAQVQRLMADELVRRCGAAVTHARSILEIGCGTGYLTKALRLLNTQAQLVAVDLDVRLIQAARAKLEGDPRTAWLVADGETLSRGAFDLIVSNSTFQWFGNPGETLRRYKECLAPGGILAFAVMGPWTFQELAASLRQSASKLNGGNSVIIPAAGFLRQSDWQHLLGQAGFGEIHPAREVLTIDFPSVKDFLASLRATGATNPVPRPLSPRLFRTLLADYQARFATNGSIPVTYELIWILARK